MLNESLNQFKFDSAHFQQAFNAVLICKTEAHGFESQPACPPNWVLRKRIRLCWLYSRHFFYLSSNRPSQRGKVSVLAVQAMFSHRARKSIDHSLHLVAFSIYSTVFIVNNKMISGLKEENRNVLDIIISHLTAKYIEKQKRLSLAYYPDKHEKVMRMCYSVSDKGNPCSGKKISEFS